MFNYGLWEKKMRWDEQFEPVMTTDSYSVAIKRVLNILAGMVQNIRYSIHLKLVTPDINSVIIHSKQSRIITHIYGIHKLTEHYMKAFKWYDQLFSRIVSLAVHLTIQSCYNWNALELTSLSLLANIRTTVNGENGAFSESSLYSALQNQVPVCLEDSESQKLSII